MLENKYSPQDLLALGFATVGEDVHIDSSCRFYQPHQIHIGSHVRIDAFVVLSAGPGGITIGNYVHLGVGVSIVGSSSVILEDFVGLSARVCVFSSNDDYSGAFMTGPMIPAEYRDVTAAPVRLQRHAIVGAGSVILPNVTLGAGSAVGALTLVKHSVAEFAIVGGNPMHRIGTRASGFLELEAKMKR